MFLHKERKNFMFNIFQIYKNTPKIQNLSQQCFVKFIVFLLTQQLTKLSIF